LTLYAWYREVLQDHLRETARAFYDVTVLKNLVSDIARRRDLQEVKRAVTRIRRSLEDEVLPILQTKLGIPRNLLPQVQTVLRLAFYMHDLGKAAVGFQRRFQQQPLQRPAFYLHEISSAYLFKEFCSSNQVGLTRQPEVEAVVRLATIAILLHHQALRALDQRYRHIFLRTHQFAVGDDDLNRMANDIAAILPSGITLNSLPALRDLLHDRSIPLARAYDELREWFREERERWKPKLYCIIAGPLMICDSLVAGAQRGEYRIHPMVLELVKGLA